jgi:cation diffusion facilitator family transporter
VVSIAVKEALYHATLRVGNRWNSKVVRANAWHHRSDSISTLVAMFGVLGAMVRLPILDPVAGLFVAGLIMKAAVELGWDSLRDLTDENVDASILKAVSAVLKQMKIEGVLSFHRLRGRAMGPFVLMDVHIHVDPSLSVSAAHQIAERTRIRVRELSVGLPIARCSGCSQAEHSETMQRSKRSN